MTATMPSFECCGVRIDAYQPTSAAATVIATPPARSMNRPGRSVHLCNAYTLSLASKEPTYQDVLNRSDLNLPDGMPLIWISKRLGLEHMVDRVYGPNLMLEVLDRGRADDLTHYLYGGTPQLLDRLRAEIEQRYPGVRIVGADAPPFRELTPAEDAAAVARMREAAPDVVWVGLGTPKQDLAVHRLADQVPATFVAVGAAFDFIAGEKRQAPGWMQRSGLEWAYRLATEPRRLWKRYLVGNTVFLAQTARSRPRRI